jgi:thioredoxin 1
MKLCSKKAYKQGGFRKTTETQTRIFYLCVSLALRIRVTLRQTKRLFSINEKSTTKQLIMADHKYITATDSNFDAEVINSDKPVLVDFWATWCGPCRMIAPVIEEIASEYEGKAKVAKLDVDANPQVSMKYGIRSIPTLLIFKNGQVVDQIVGAVPKGVIDGKLKLQTA